MPELPVGWHSCQLGNVASFEMGQAPPGATCNFSGIGTPFVKAGEFSVVRPLLREWTTNPLKFARSTDVLICVVGATAGKVNLGADCAIGRSVAAIKPTDLASQRFLYYQLGFNTDGLRSAASGSAQPVISRQLLSGWPIVLPPLAEQKRIADKLDTLLARINTCRERLERLPALIKRFRQAVLHWAYCSGPMDTQQIAATWPTVALGELATELRNGRAEKPNEVRPGLAILRISSVRSMSVCFADLRFLPTLNESSMLLRRDDLLFTRYNGSLELVGVCGRVREEPNEATTYPDKLIRVRLNERRALPDWVEIVANAPASRRRLMSKARTSAGQTGISGKDLKDLPIPLPPLEDQRAIVDRVSQLLHFADLLDSRLVKARTCVSNLTVSILSKAFQGELVPQDPTDEPVALLSQSSAPLGEASQPIRRARKKHSADAPVA